MKKTELSIGDLVKVPELVYDNGSEDFNNGICKIRQLRCTDLDVYAYEDLEYSEIEPILITNVILTKIGFVEKDSSRESNTFEFRLDNLVVNYSTTLAIVDIVKVKEKFAEQNTTEFEEGNKIVFNLSAKILYLHQLQHLLRMVGIELNEIQDAGLMSIYEF